MLNCLWFILINAQAYQQINVRMADRITTESSTGIVVNSIAYQNEGTFVVVLENTNHSAYGTVTSNSFYWYLSYKGKRVSDYYQSTIRCGNTREANAVCWPSSVPSGYEKYVTVQLGREYEGKNRRDDF